MAPAIPAAFLAAEDAGFFLHDGIDWTAVARAALGRLRGRRGGASTVAQQLVKLRDGAQGAPRTLVVKLREAVLARKLVRRHSRAAILEAYLNRVPLWGNCRGVPCAARALFGAAADEVTPAQAALLAALARGPTTYDPRRHPERARARRDWVLRRMHALGALTDDEHAAAAASPLQLAPRSLPAPALAPHFVRGVLRTAHARSALARDAPFPATRTLATTLDAPLQRRLEALVRDALGRLRAHGAGQAAALVVDNETAEVLAYVGSAGLHSGEAGFVDGVRALRQPGSALKPFAYALAFDAGVTPATLLDDTRRTFAEARGGYRPRNATGEYRGPVLAAEALARSLNVPAVELAERLTPARLLEGLRRFGFVSLGGGADEYGLGLVLGNGEVSLWELARAYLALARGGEVVPLRRFQDRTERGSAPVTRAVSRVSAYQVARSLTRTSNYFSESMQNAPLALPFEAALKTGTSDRFRDGWAAGFTRALTVAVWVGNFDGRPTRGLMAIDGAAPLWTAIVRAAMALRVGGRVPAERPAGLVAVRLCSRSGRLAAPGCPAETFELRPGTASRLGCRAHPSSAAAH